MLALIANPISVYYYLLGLLILSAITCIRFYRIRAVRPRYFFAGLIFWGLTFTVDWDADPRIALGIIGAVYHANTYPPMTADQVVLFTLIRSACVVLAAVLVMVGLKRLSVRGRLGADSTAAHCPNPRCTMRLASKTISRCPECGMSVRMKSLVATSPA